MAFYKYHLSLISMRLNEPGKVALLTLTTRRLLLLGPMECGIKCYHFRLEMQRIQNKSVSYIEKNLSSLDTFIV